MMILVKLLRKIFEKIFRNRFWTFNGKIFGKTKSLNSNPYYFKFTFHTIGWIFLILFFVACEKAAPEFAFFAADLSELNAQQKNWYQPNVFKKLRGELTFPENTSLWFHYEPEKMNYSNPYAISLSQKSLGYNEIDLRNQVILKSKNAIMDHYDSLPVGEYLLRIAYNNEVIAQREFKIIPDSNSSEIDYEAPIKENVDLADSDSEDDITRLSKE